MLRFAEKPDKIFTEILASSFIIALDNLKDVLKPSDFKCFFPNASRNFNQFTANTTLKDLIRCNKSPGLWSLNDYHYVLIYDAVKYFCDIVEITSV